MTSLIKKKWEVSEGRVREKLLRLIGQIGREAKQAKSIEATLQVLWEVVSVITNILFQSRGSQTLYELS